MGATGPNCTVLRRSLREAARKVIGDTGLLDFLLKHLVGKQVSAEGHSLRRRHNDDGHMEYWLQPAGCSESAEMGSETELAVLRQQQREGMDSRAAADDVDGLDAEMRLHSPGKAGQMGVAGWGLGGALEEGMAEAELSRAAAVSGLMQMSEGGEDAAERARPRGSPGGAATGEGSTPQPRGRLEDVLPQAAAQPSRTGLQMLPAASGRARSTSCGGGDSTAAAPLPLAAPRAAAAPLPEALPKAATASAPAALPAAEAGLSQVVIECMKMIECLANTTASLQFQVLKLEEHQHVISSRLGQLMSGGRTQADASTTTE